MTTPRTVALFSTGLPDPTQGGSGIFNYLVTDELLRRGHRVVAVFRVSQAFADRAITGSYLRALQERGLEVETVGEDPPLRRRDFGISVLERLHSYESSRRAAESLVMREALDFCISLDLGWALALADLPVRRLCILGDPYHRRVRETTPFSLQRRATWGVAVRAKSVEWSMPRLAERLRPFAESDSALLASFAPQHVEEFRAAGLDCRHIRWFVPGPEKVERHPPTDRLRLLHVGDLASTASRQMLRYWDRELFPAASRLAYPIDLEFVGRDDTLQQPIGTWPNIRVIFSGHVDDLQPHFAAATAYLSPMNYRVGVRTRILTALAHGVPVVASTTAALGLPELRDGVDIVYADDGPAVAGILSQLADDASLGEHLGAAARRSWERFYDARVNVPALVDLAELPATE